MQTDLERLLRGPRAAVAARERGYSLIELMLVVAIVGVFGALVVPSFTTRTQSNKVEAAVKLLRSKVERARLLSTEVGPRIGEAGASWVYNGCAVTTPSGYLWSSVDNAGAYSIPAEITFDRNPASATYQQVSVTCDTGTLTQLISEATGDTPNQVSPTVVAPVAGPPLVYAFSASGRLCFDGGAAGPCAGPRPADTSFVLQATADQKRYGFRVFESGVLCTTSVPGSATQCDAD